MKNSRSYQDTSWMFAKPPQPWTAPTADTRTLEAAHRSVQRDQIAALLLAAGVIGGAVAVIGMILAGVVIYLTYERAPYAWVLLPLALVAGVITAAVLAIQWTHKAAVRAWLLEDEDRLYRLREIDDLAELRRAQPGTARRDIVRVELSQPLDGQARQTQIAELDATPEQLRRLADGLLSGAPLAESAWTGAGRPFSRGQFAQLRAIFLARGWADWRNPDAPAQGVTLTPQGRAVVRSLASEIAALPYQVTDHEQNG